MLSLVYVVVFAFSISMQITPITLDIFLFPHHLSIQMCASKWCAVGVTVSPTPRLAPSPRGSLVWTTTNALPNIDR